MTVLDWLLDAPFNPLVFVVSTAISAIPALVAVGIIGHFLMVPIRKTRFGAWASTEAARLADKVRAAHAARTAAPADAKAGVQ
jgi:hypothetical protein